MGTRRGRRLAIRLTACAVIGAVATVAVAWTGSAFAPTPPSIRGAAERIPWHTPLPERWPGYWPPLLFTAEFSSPACVLVVGQAKAAVFDTGDYRPDSSQRWTATQFRAGWPRPALCGERFVFEDQGQTVRRAARAVWGNEAKPLPARPLPGFALDTAFYAAIAFALWSAPGWCAGASDAPAATAPPVATT